jgi:DNA-directed RNA polymerase subunit RPC12/RpoP
MPTLFVKCRACNQEIPSPVAEPKGDPSGVMISGLKIRCPKCGHEAEYSTADFHLPGGTGGPPSGGQVVGEESLASEHEAKLEGAQEKYAGYGVVPPEGRSPHEGSS